MSYILIINLYYIFKRIVLVRNMAPLYTSHVDDCLYSICEDDPRHAFPRITRDYRYFFRDSERGNRFTWVESLVDSRSADVDLIFTPGHMAEVDRSFQ